MVRRFAQVSLAIFLVLALATMASAAPNTANTTQKGSLLVFPKVQCFGDASCSAANTFFFIANDNTAGTWVKCYWMDNNQSVEDFHFYITANQPIVFSAGDNPYGPPFGDNRAGSLVCWAQDANDYNPVAWDHLYGYAMLTNGGTPAAGVFYIAYSFAQNGGNLVGLVDGAIALLLNGTGYNYCPKYLVTEFVPADEGSPSVAGGYPDVTFWPCKQDLRQDRSPTCTKVKFDIWDYNEWKYTGAYQCFKCFFEGFLHQIGDKAGKLGPYKVGKWIWKRGPGFGGEKFTKATLGYDLGLGALAPWTPARLRAQGIASDQVCVTNGFTGTKYDGITCKKTVNTGMLGVFLYATPLAFDITADGTAPGVVPLAGHTFHGAGIANTSPDGTVDNGGPCWVKYDRASDSVDTAAGR